MALDQRVSEGAGPGGLGLGGSKFTLDPRDDRQHRAGDTLATDVEHRPYLLHTVDRGQTVGERTQRRERGAVEQVSGTGGGPDDAIPIGRAEAIGHLINEAEVGVGVAEQRTQVVVDPEA